MKTKRRIISVWSAPWNRNMHELQRHVNYSLLEWFGCEGWWVTELSTISRELANHWASDYNIDFEQ